MVFLLACSFLGLGSGCHVIKLCRFRSLVFIFDEFAFYVKIARLGFWGFGVLGFWIGTHDEYDRLISK